MRMAVLALLLAAAPAIADEAPSVAVTTVAPARRAVPDTLSAWGTAGPALDGGVTLSQQQDGRVEAIDVTPGERVAKGEALIEFGASAAASSAFHQAQTALSVARTERAHTARLLAQQLATRDQLAQADKAVSDAQAQLDALRREGAGPLTRTLTAPFAGIVATVPVAQGDRVAAGTALLTLTRLDGLVITVGIEPAMRARVQPGQPAELSPIAGGPALSGRVLRVDAVLNPKTRLVDTDISVPTGAVMSGEAFEASIQVGTLDGWVVPHDAVLTGSGSAYVFQVRGGKAARVSVRVLGQTAQGDSVQGALDPAAPVVVAGSYQLSDGMAVRDAKQGG